MPTFQGNYILNKHNFAQVGAHKQKWKLLKRVQNEGALQPLFMRESKGAIIEQTKLGIALLGLRLAVKKREGEGRRKKRRAHSKWTPMRFATRLLSIDMRAVLAEHAVQLNW
jgi:hypothetical protein